MKRLLMGNEAIALGAIRAGVRFAAGYPGTPSSEILETLVKEKPRGVYAEWSVNEKSALEAAAGAAIAGALSMVTMKQVGLNVASDPLMSLNYVGVKGGMVIVVADDPGPISSQTEQDTRHFGLYAHIPVFDPSTPEEAYTMMADAFACSAEIKRPVIVRPTTRVCHSYASVELLEPLTGSGPEGFTKDQGKWAIFPKLAYTNHLKIVESQKGLEKIFSSYEKNVLIKKDDKAGTLNRGIVSGGVSWQYVMEILHRFENYRALKISTYPLPSDMLADFLQGLDEVLVIEELDPVIEKELLCFCGAHAVSCVIKGKLTGDMPAAGENSPAWVHEAIVSFLTGKEPPTSILEKSGGMADTGAQKPALPARPPMLCAGCPHRASFFAVKEAVKGRKAVFSGDIGCYTLGNALPLDMLDTCLCMGAGITMAQGINRIEPDTLNFAFIGDSTFFHTGIPGIINGVYNGADIIIAILDNGTTAMTGGQPHPGTEKTLMGTVAPRIDIHALVSALNVASLRRVNAFDFTAAKAAVSGAAGEKGVRVIIFEGPCIALVKSEQKVPCAVNPQTCTGCGVCVKKLGCPALFLAESKTRIDTALCTGCELCKVVCPAKAIEGAPSGGTIC